MKEFSRYNPKTIFKGIIHCIEEKQPATSKELIVLLLKLLEDEKDISLESSKKSLKSVQNFLIDIFASEKNKDWVGTQVSKISVQEVEINKAILQQAPIPVDITTVLSHIIQFSQRKIEEKVALSENVVLVFGSIRLTGELFIGKVGMKESKTFNNIPQSVMEQYACMLYDFSTGAICPFIRNKEFLQQLIGNHKECSTIILNYKCYNYQEDNMIDFGDLSEDKNIFIYCDRLYQNAQIYLDYWNDCQVHWILMEYRSIHAIVIKFREHRFFILPMTPMAAEAAVKDIVSTRPNFHFCSCDSNDRVDGVVMQDEKTAKQLDSVVTALFFFIEKRI